MGTTAANPAEPERRAPVAQQPPLLLLDIDGVLNVLGRADGARQLRVGGFVVTLPTWHPHAVLALEAAGFEILWSTMWMESARTHFAPEVGFGADWDYVDFEQHWGDPALSRQIELLTRGIARPEADDGSSVGSYKHPGILATVGDRPAVVVDDDLEPWQHAWAVRRSEGGIPTLTVQPDPAVGLTPDHVEQILAFARRPPL